MEGSPGCGQGVGGGSLKLAEQGFCRGVAVGGGVAGSSKRQVGWMGGVSNN